MPQRTLAASSRADHARPADRHPMPAHRRRQSACGPARGPAGSAADVTSLRRHDGVHRRPEELIRARAARGRDSVLTEPSPGARGAFGSRDDDVVPPCPHGRGPPAQDAYGTLPSTRGGHRRQRRARRPRGASHVEAGVDEKTAGAEEPRREVVDDERRLPYGVAEVHRCVERVRDQTSPRRERRRVGRNEDEAPARREQVADSGDRGASPSRRRGAVSLDVARVSFPLVPRRWYPPRAHREIESNESTYQSHQHRDPLKPSRPQCRQASDEGDEPQ